MKNNTFIALEMLKNGNFTCVATNGEMFHTSTKKGVKPLLSWFDDKVDVNDFCAADKVVGKAAAFLYVLLGVTEVYACVISKASTEVFEKYGVEYYYDTLVDAIRNRTNTGYCPMEQAVKNVNIPDDAYIVIKETLQKLSSV